MPHRKKLKRRINLKGDTIIEVLVCMAIVTTVLAGAFVVTHRSTIGVEESSEHHAALQLAQTQLEEVKGLADTNPTSVFDVTADFCVVNVNNVVAATNMQCQVDNSGTPTTTQPVYTISVSRDTSTDRFTATVTWPGFDGNSSQVQLAYVIHKPVNSSLSGGSTAFSEPPYDCILLDTCDTSGDGGGDPGGGGGPPPPPAYFFGFAFINRTDSNEKSLITGCTWDFGDGTPAVNNVDCMPGDEIDHDFAPPAGLDTSTFDASKCYTYPVTVTLTTHLSNGFNPVYSSVRNLPGCP